MVAYIVKGGETLFDIAAKYDVSVDQLVKINPHIPHPSMTFAGQLIYIPMKKEHPAYPNPVKCLIPYMPDYLQVQYVSYYTSLNAPAVQAKNGPVYLPEYSPSEMEPVTGNSITYHAISQAVYHPESTNLQDSAQKPALRSKRK